MSEATVVAVIGVVAGLVAALLGTAWLNRKNIARLTRAQADNSEATTIEISDRIARNWLKDLEERLKETNLRLDEEVRVRRGAIAYIERLLEWMRDSGLGDAAPPLPAALKAYVSEPN